MIQVPGQGNKNTTIAIVGEAPGADEISYYENGVLSPKPFVGAAGQRLDKQLMAAGINRDDCWVTNVWKEKLKDNDFSVLWEDAKETKATKELEEALKVLRIELQELKNLKVIIALGRHSLYCLTRNDGITKWRGSVLPSINDFQIEKLDMLITPKVIPTFHPSFILRQYIFNPIVIADLKKAKRESLTLGFNYPKYEYILPTNIIDVLSFLEEVKKHPRIFLDIETIPDMEMITRVGIAFNRFKGISIPFYSYQKCRSFWSKSDEKIIWIELSKFFNSGIEIAIQNIPYDRSYLERKYGLKLKNIVFDPMQAQHVIVTGLSKPDAEGSATSVRPFGLGMLTSLYTSQPFYKDDGKEIATNGRIDDDQQSMYNIKDCCVSFAVMEEQQKVLQFKKQKHIFDFEMELVNRPLKFMMDRGIKIDLEYKEKMSKKYEKCQELNQLRFNQLLKADINLNSPKQIQKLLFNHLNLPKNKDNSTDEEQLLRLKDKKHDCKEIDYILYNRTTAKTKENFETDVDYDGRMRCQYTCLTQTGRLSSRKNPFGTGTNLQNRDRRGFVRKQFIADEGMILIENDLEQAELRALGYFARCNKLIDEFEAGEDSFAKLASKCLNRKITKKENKLERDTFKRVIHGARNRMGGRTLSVILMKELGTFVKSTICDYWLESFFNMYPEIRRWQESIISQVNNYPKLISPFGREIEFYDRFGEERNKKACAWLPQSFIGDLLNHIMLDCFDSFNSFGIWELLLQNHDAFLWQCKKGEEKVWIEKVKEKFNVTNKINEYNVVIPVEFKVGLNWGEMEVVK